MMETEGLSFDHIAVKKMGGYNLISVQDWLSISPKDRVVMILQEKVQFLKEDEVVPTIEALKSLKAALENGVVELPKEHVTQTPRVAADY